eukprot:Tbor_TRINITY_DN5665_c1_g2::TRINITY_DN5665_c1_g2_i3::g.9440::m.9440
MSKGQNLDKSVLAERNRKCYVSSEHDNMDEDRLTSDIKDVKPKFADVCVNTIEQCNPECFEAPIRFFISEIWIRSRKALEDCRERDLFVILKPMEIHMRVTMLGYFLPRRSLMIDEEVRERNLLEELENIRRQGLKEMFRHASISIPTIFRLNAKYNEINDVSRKITLCMSTTRKNHDIDEK